MNKERMLKWAEFLRTVPDMKFDMGTWGDPKRGRMGKQPQCVSRACALGWATAIPEFKKLGLHLVAEPGSDSADVLYSDRFNEFAAMEFFGLTHSQAGELVFFGSRDPKKKADEIEAMALGR